MESKLKSSKERNTTGMGFAQHRPCRGKKWAETGIENNNFPVLGYFSLALFIFEAFLGKLLAFFWKCFFW